MVPLSVKIQVANAIALRTEILDMKIRIEEWRFQHTYGIRLSCGITVERHTLVKDLKNVGELHVVHIDKHSIFRRFRDVAIDLQESVFGLGYQEIIHMETLALNGNM